MPKTPAEIEATLRQMTRVSMGIARNIDGNEAAMNGQLLKLQRALFELLVAEFLTGFDTDSGALKATSANLARVSAIDRLFDALRRSQIGGIIDDFAGRLNDIIRAVGDYFRIGFAASTVDRISESNAAIHAIIGIKDGKLIPGGYLDRLARAEELRNQLKNYMTASIINRASLRDITRGLSVLVQGSPDVDGFLVRYYRQYAYDTFNQVREIKNRQFADGLGLKYFIYQGSIIETSRKFCEKKAGKVFTTDQAKKWKDDPDLIDQKTKATYNPLIERGRYNCRHWIDYISEEAAQYLLKKQKQVA